MVVEFIDKKTQILEAAQECFLEKGYAGTSISTIASKANVPKALIYHYYENKKALWTEVKLNILQGYFKEDILSQTPLNNFYDFLSYVISKRIDIYAHTPELSKMIHWQALEETEEANSLRSKPTSKTMENWYNAIIDFQKRKEIRSDFSPSLILTMIMQSSSGPFLTSSHPFGTENSEEQIKAYESMLIEVLYKGLRFENFY